MSLATMSLASLHSQLEKQTAELAQQQQAAQQELAAAKAAYDEWDAPRRRYRAAIAVMENLARSTPADLTEAALRKAFAPFVELPRRRLAAETGRTSAAYVRGAEQILEARMAAIRAAVARLDTMHLDRSITDPESAVREFVDNLKLPLLPSEKF